MRNFTPQIVYLDPNDIVLYPRNGKEHTPEQVAGIAQQISTFGFDQPIVVNRDKVLIKGEGRTLASRLLKLKEVPCIIRDDLSDVEQMASRIGDNRVAESAWRNENLAQDFADLRAGGFNLELTGFAMPQIEVIENGWQTDFGKVEKIVGNTDGIQSVIKVICPQHARQDVKTIVAQAIADSGLADVEIE